MNGWWLHGGMFCDSVRSNGEKWHQNCPQDYHTAFCILLSLSLNLPWTLSFWSLSIKTTPIDSYLLHPGDQSIHRLPLASYICLAYITFYRWSICWQPCANPKTTWLEWWIQSILFMRNCWRESLLKLRTWILGPGIKVQPLLVCFWWWIGVQISSNFTPLEDSGTPMVNLMTDPIRSPFKPRRHNPMTPRSDKFLAKWVSWRKNHEKHGGKPGFLQSSPRVGFEATNFPTDQLHPVGCGSPLG